MADCVGELCLNNFQLVANSNLHLLDDTYQTFLEVLSFLIFAFGVVLNTGILTLLIAVSSSAETFDYLMMNLVFSQLVASFGIAFIFFVEFTTSIAPIGDAGCRFISWLTFTSSAVPIFIIIVLVVDVYRKVIYNDIRAYTHLKICLHVILPWLCASVLPIPFMITSYMGKDRQCHMQVWTRKSVLIYISLLICIEIIIPLAVIAYFIVRLYIYLNASRMGDTMLVEEVTPGSEENFQRAVLKRKVNMLTYIFITTLGIIATVAFIELALVLNINNIEANVKKHEKIRQLGSLIECFACVITPTLLLFHYDFLKKKLKNVLPCFKDHHEIYNTLSFNVYQQTVHENVSRVSQPLDQNTNQEDDIYETERDDIAILN